MSGWPKLGRSRQRGEDISTIEQVRPVVDAALAELALVAEDVAMTPAGKRSVLRIAVDRDLDRLDLPDDSALVPSLTLDEVAEATKSVSSALDDSDVMGPRPYVLEVTSPGVDRPLTAPRHFRRNVGRLVQLTLDDGSTVVGRISAVRRGQVRLGGFAGRPAEADAYEVAFDRIARAQVQVEFAHALEQED